MPTPPKNVPNLDLANQSVILDTRVLTITDNKVGTFSVLEPGTPFPKSSLSEADYAKYSAFMLMGQSASADFTEMNRVFAPLPSTQDVDNYDIDYVADAAAFPSFTRRYIETRDGYQPRADGSFFTGLFAIRMTAAGANYTSEPVISFAGGTGTGATAKAVLTSTGGIGRIVIKAEGVSFNGSETVGITGGGGAGATAVVVVQPANCYLIKETADEKAPPPYDSLCLLVTRTYTTLPGPPLVGITTTEYGNAITISQTVRPGVNPTIDPGTLDASVTPNSKGVATLKTTEYAAFPTGYLYGYVVDVNTDIGVRTRKRLVANGFEEGGIFQSDAATIASVDLLTPCTITLAAPLTIKTGEIVNISGENDATPHINGDWVATVVDSTHIQIPTTVISVAGPALGIVRLKANWYMEIQPLNDRQAIEISSQVDTSTFAFASKTYSEWINYPWAEVLVGIETYNDTGAESTSASGTFPIPTQLTWAWGCTFNGTVAIRSARYTGKTSATITTSFSIGPVAADAVQLINLSSGEIVVKGGAVNKHIAYSLGTSTSGTETSLGISIRYSTVRIENCLTNGFSSGTLAGGGTLFASIVMKLNPSNPTTFVAGTSFLADSSVKQGRLGMWTKENVSVLVPTPFP